MTSPTEVMGPDREGAASREDNVTSPLGRDGFAAVLGTLCAQAAAMETRLSVLAVAWDSFPALQAQGDAALCEAALAALAGRLPGGLRRSEDGLGFLGDGVFGVMLPRTDSSGADCVARRLQALFQPLPSAAVSTPADADERPARLALRGTLSIGVASYGGRGPVDASALIAAAEAACRVAQVDGGNKIVRRDAALGRAPG
jgi:GGDEF domain-containing protein